MSSWRAVLLLCSFQFACFLQTAESTEFDAAAARRNATSSIQAEQLPFVRMMIEHAFESYVNSAFPKDELKPISGEGANTLGSYALTMVDALDLLALAGFHDEFRKYSRWVQDNVDFDVDKQVSVFETSIRILGGLLSAHFMYEEGIVAVDATVDDYDGGLLRLAVDLAKRLLPAFNTPTGIPYGSVNLRHGVPRGEIDITSTAGGGTFLLEMTVISAVTGDGRFEAAARRAALALVAHRNSGTDLVGNHININTGMWTLDQSSVGSGVDSLLEYLIKGTALTGDPQLYQSYRLLHDAFAKYTRKGPYFIETNVQGQPLFLLHNSLAAFYPGNLALSGMYLDEAVETVFATHAILKAVGAMPEGFHLFSRSPQPGQVSYPLRPEHAESLYMLYRTTHDPVYLELGKEFALMLWTRTATLCGFATLNDCSVPPHAAKYSDAMESFLLSETLKYLYLLFDEDNYIHRATLAVNETVVASVVEEDIVDEEFVPWLFNTEGHPIPVREEWRLWRRLDHSEMTANAEKENSKGSSVPRGAEASQNLIGCIDRLWEQWSSHLNSRSQADASAVYVAEAVDNEFAVWSPPFYCFKEERDFRDFYQGEGIRWSKHSHTIASDDSVEKHLQNLVDQCVAYNATFFPRATANHEKYHTGWILNDRTVFKNTDTVPLLDEEFHCSNVVGKLNAGDGAACARVFGGSAERLSHAVWHRQYDYADDV